MDRGRRRRGKAWTNLDRSGCGRTACSSSDPSFFQSCSEPDCALDPGAYGLRFVDPLSIAVDRSYHSRAGACRIVGPIQGPDLRHAEPPGFPNAGRRGAGSAGRRGAGSAGLRGRGRRERALSIRSSLGLACHDARRRRPGPVSWQAPLGLRVLGAPAPAPPQPRRARRRLSRRAGPGGRSHLRHGRSHPRLAPRRVRGRPRAAGAPRPARSRLPGSGQP